MPAQAPLMSTVPSKRMERIVRAQPSLGPDRWHRDGRGGDRLLDLPGRGAVVANKEPPQSEAERDQHQQPQDPGERAAAPALDGNLRHLISSREGVRRPRDGAAYAAAIYASPRALSAGRRPVGKGRRRLGGAAARAPPRRGAAEAHV